VQLPFPPANLFSDSFTGMRAGQPVSHIIAITNHNHPIHSPWTKSSPTPLFCLFNKPFHSERLLQNHFMPILILDSSPASQLFCTNMQDFYTCNVALSIFKSPFCRGRL